MSDLRISSWPWEYVPGTEHHGPYVAGLHGGDICDCYAMSNPLALSQRNGGTSKPVWHQAEFADANARLIAMAPELYEELKAIAERADSVKLRLCDDPNEYSDAEKHQALNALYDSIGDARAALAKARGEQ